MAEYVMEYDGWADGIPIGEYLKVRDAMHARKREAVVRCRDCKSSKQTAYGMMCHHFSMSSGAGWPVEPDGFCAWGERKDA
jgi:hypothetical protein